MPVSRASTLPNSSPVTSRSVGFCEGVRTRCNPSAPTPSRGAPASSASVDSASSLRTRAIIGGECTIEAHAMSVLRPWFLLLLLPVAAGAGGGYLADRMGLAPGRAPPRPPAEPAAPILAPTQRRHG